MHAGITVWQSCKLYCQQCKPPLQWLLFQGMEQHHNGAGLRALQGRKQLEALIKRVKQTRDHMQWGRSGPPPLLVKIAPDLTEADKSDIAAVSMKLGIDGLIISNTTITRPGGVVDHPTGNEVRQGLPP